MYTPFIIVGTSDVGSPNDVYSRGLNAYINTSNSKLYIKSNNLWAESSNSGLSYFYDPFNILTYKKSINGVTESWSITTPIFAWLPDEGSEESIQPTINVAKFGDGYEQRAQVGINSEVQSWTMTFTGNMDVVIFIRNFLRKMGAVNAFYWTSPINEGGMYVCRSFPMKKIGTSILQLSVKFERVYEVRL